MLTLNKYVYDFYQDLLQNDPSSIKKRFIQPPDFDGTKKYNMLPQITCLTNLIARINKIEKQNNQIKIIHDYQKEFSTPMKNIISEMKQLRDQLNFKTEFTNFKIPNELEVDYENSRSYFGIQCADIFAGLIMNYFRDSNKYSMYKEYINKLNPHINFVLPDDSLLFLLTLQI